MLCFDLSPAARDCLISEAAMVEHLNSDFIGLNVFYLKVVQFYVFRFSFVKKKIPKPTK